MIQILRKFILYQPTLLTSPKNKSISLYSISGHPDIRKDLPGQSFVFYFSSEEEVMEARKVFWDHEFFPKGIELGGWKRKERVWYTPDTDYSKVYFPYCLPVHIYHDFGEVRKELRKRGYYYWWRREAIL